jgi:predicted 2-oxoglutarate/Fe(II)-dependent dioxygenase YbiX
MFNEEIVNALSNYIKVYDDIIPEDVCDRIISEYGETDEWLASKVGNDVLDRSVRNVESIPISMPESLHRNWDTRYNIDKLVWEAAGRSISAYNADFPLCKIEEDCGYMLLKYEEGQFYKEHTDSYKQHPRAVTAIFGLNNDYSGGEFGFFQGSVKYSIKKGSVLMFPSNFMYPHEVLEVTQGTRFSIVTWFI